MKRLGTLLLLLSLGLFVTGCPKSTEEAPKDGETTTTTDDGTTTDADTTDDKDATTDDDDK